MYLQMMAEPLSRVGACAPGTQEEKQRLSLSYTMGQAQLLGLQPEQWRKNSQW
jgi:hypothetical protein